MSWKLYAELGVKTGCRWFAWPGMEAALCYLMEASQWASIVIYPHHEAHCKSNSGFTLPFHNFVSDLLMV